MRKKKRSKQRQDIRQGEERKQGEGGGRRVQETRKGVERK